MFYGALISPSDLRLAGCSYARCVFHASAADHRRYIVPRRTHVGRLDKAGKSYFPAVCRVVIKMPGTPGPPERDLLKQAGTVFGNIGY